MGAEIDKKAVQPRAVRYNAKDQYFDPVRDKRMSELTTSQQDDARELWLIENLEAMVEYYKHHLRFLLDRVAGLRAELQQCRTGALQQAPIGVPELEAALRRKERMLCAELADEQWVRDPRVSGGEAIRNA
jgi:hypothetical protein